MSSVITAVVWSVQKLKSTASIWVLLQGDSINVTIFMEFFRMLYDWRVLLVLKCTMSEYLCEHNSLFVKYSSLTLLWGVRTLTYKQICLLALMTVNLWFHVSPQNSKFYAEWVDISVAVSHLCNSSFGFSDSNLNYKRWCSFCVVLLRWWWWWSAFLLLSF
jgi:hypothetical protein